MQILFAVLNNGNSIFFINMTLSESNYCIFTDNIEYLLGFYHITLQRSARIATRSVFLPLPRCCVIWMTTGRVPSDSTMCDGIVSMNLYRFNSNIYNYISPIIFFYKAFYKIVKRKLWIAPKEPIFEDTRQSIQITVIIHPSKPHWIMKTCIKNDFLKITYLGFLYFSGKSHPAAVSPFHSPKAIQVLSVTSKELTLTDPFQDPCCAIICIIQG